MQDKTSQIRNLIEPIDFNLKFLTETRIKDNPNDEFFHQQRCPSGYFYLTAEKK